MRADRVSQKPRITVCVLADGTFEILLNEAGRDLMVRELQGLSRRWDHFHLDHIADPELDYITEVPLSARPYRNDDKVLESGKVLFRPDDWDREYYPHVLEPEGED
jgi:hypothetical protein